MSWPAKLWLWIKLLFYIFLIYFGVRVAYQLFTEGWGWAAFVVVVVLFPVVFVLYILGLGLNPEISETEKMHYYYNNDDET